MTFYETLDSIMKQDFGGRGLLASLPASPLAAVSASLAHAKRAVLLTGFPVRMPDGSITGETDGPSGTANLAAALTAAGCGVSGSARSAPNWPDCGCDKWALPGRIQM